jgi:hypothetical protein
MFVTFLSASHMHLSRGYFEARVQDVKDDSSHASCTQNDRSQTPKSCDSRFGSAQENFLPAVEALSKPFRDGVLVDADTALDKIASVLWQTFH